MATLKIGTQSIVDHLWPDLARFITGGWFEQFVYGLAQRLLVAGKIKDLARNVEAVTETETTRAPSQEFDIAMTNGYGLTIVECKAGKIEQEHVQKLENLRQAFGGHFGKAILVASRPESLEQVRKRIESSGKICAISGQALALDPDLLLTCKERDIILN